MRNAATFCGGVFFADGRGYCLGRQCGKPSFQKPLVMRILRVPSTFMTHRSPPCSYAMRVPSGEKLGAPAALRGSPVGLVSRTGLEPSAFMIQTAKFLSRSDWNAIFVPSGDHAGVRSDPAWLVRFTWPEPSAFM